MVMEIENGEVLKEGTPIIMMLRLPMVHVSEVCKRQLRLRIKYARKSYKAITFRIVSYGKTSHQCLTISEGATAELIVTCEADIVYTYFGFQSSPSLQVIVQSYVWEFH